MLKEQPSDYLIMFIAKQGCITKHLFHCVCVCLTVKYFHTVFCVPVMYCFLTSYQKFSVLKQRFKIFLGLYLLTRLSWEILLLSEVLPGVTLESVFSQEVGWG